jgi:hypothetical protein
MQALFHGHPSPLLQEGSEAVAQQRLAMSKIKDILRLHLLGGVTSCRRIGRAVGCGKTAVSTCLQRAAEAGLRSWEAVKGLDEEELQRRLYRTAAAARPAPVRRERPLPDWLRNREELGVSALTTLIIYAPVSKKSPIATRPSLLKAAAKCILTYKLIRLLVAQAAAHADVLPRQLSFKHTLQVWVASSQRQFNSDAPEDTASLFSHLFFTPKLRDNVNLRP